MKIGELTTNYFSELTLIIIRALRVIVKKH